MADDSEFFSSPRVYLQSAANTKDLICKIDIIIDATLAAMLKGATDEDVNEYRLNDGQTIISVQTRSVKQMADSITNLEAIKQIYVNRYNGHSVRLVDHESTRFLSAI